MRKPQGVPAMIRMCGFTVLAMTISLIGLTPACAKPVSGSTKSGGTKDLEKLWDTLASDDAAKAFKAMGEMASSPKESVAFLNGRLKPIAPADPKVVAKLLDDLNDAQYAVRQKASAELEKLADLAGPALREKLESKPSLEMRKRIEALIDKLEGPITMPELLRSLRAIELLELIGTPEAREALVPLAKGAPGHRQTEAAEGAVKRLDKRLKAKGK